MLIPAPGETLADAIAKAVLSTDPSVPLRFIRHLGDDDVYHRGPMPGGALFVLPGIWTGQPAELLAIMRMRRAAAVTGRCPSCQECADLAAGTLRHEHGCGVADNTLGPMLRRWSRRVGLVRGRRIQEQPDGAVP
jgi:hypothetical protein